MNKKFILLFILFFLKAHAENKTAIELIKQNKYNEAILVLNEALKTNSKDAVDWFNLGISSYKSKNYPAAIKAFQKTNELNSSLKEAALYYKALSEFNLRQNASALNSISQISESSGFYNIAKELKNTIEELADDSFLEAIDAYEEDEYEACRDALENSLMADHPLGVELSEKCKEELSAEQKKTNEPRVKESKFYLTGLISAGYSNNAFLVNRAPTGRIALEASLGAEYLFLGENEYGVGLNYENSIYGNGNAGAGVTGSRESLWNIYIPYTKDNDKYEYGLEAYYNRSTIDSATAYSQLGIILNYLYHMNELFNVGISPDLSRKTASSSTYSYLEGTYSSYKAYLGYEKNKFKSSLFLKLINEATNDQAVTGGTLPYANRATEIGITVSQGLTEKMKISGILSNSVRNYTNKYSSIFREDQTRYLKAQASYKASEVTKLYIESLNTTNTSNYDNTQVLNKNYTENAINIGLVFNN